MVFTRRINLPSVLFVWIIVAGLTVGAGPRPPWRAPVQTQALPDSRVKLATDLVSLSVAVTDRSGRAITGLTKSDFKVYENGLEQSISFFSSDQTPVSWGLVLDRSGSMRGMMEDVYQAAINVISEGTEQDEVFIVTFNNRCEIACHFTSDQQRLEKSVRGLRAEGLTALYDAVAFSLDHIKQGRHPKKVLVVVTDGEDNNSRLTFRQLRERTKEQDVLIYTVGMFESMGIWRFPLKGGNGRSELRRLAEVTGAFAHFPANVEKCREAMQDIAREVSRCYNLAYYPTFGGRDGKWRKIRVDVARKESDIKYAVRTRAGYYPPNGDEK